MRCWEHVALSRQCEKASENSLSKASVHLVFRHLEKIRKLAYLFPETFARILCAWDKFTFDQP